MSRFFESLEEEKAEVKKKLFATDTGKSKTKQSKKEKMMHELQSRVFDLEDDVSKKSEKNIKKFISDLKKYECCFDEIPKFLMNFLTSDRVYVKSNKVVIDKFISQYSKETKTKENVVFETKVAKSDEQELNDIIKINDNEKRTRLLLELMEQTNSEDLQIDVMVLLLVIYYKDKDVDRIENVLDKLSSFLDNEKVYGILKNNLDDYLEIIKGKYVNGSENKNSSERYTELLKKFKCVDEVVFERRMIEYNKNYVKTKYLDFELISLAQKGLFKDALALFGSYKGKLVNNLKGLERFKEEISSEIDSFHLVQDYIFIRNIETFGHYLFNEKEYFYSFVCFYFVYQNGKKQVELDLFLLCVVLNKKVSKTDIFKLFLKSFRELENNIFMSKSNDQRHEILRSFYFLNLFDLKRCYDILLKYEFKEYSLLEDFVKNNVSVQ